MRITNTHSAFFVETTFRCLDDEQVAAMQHQMIDRRRAVSDVAAEFGGSVATGYRVKRAVPEDLVQIDLDTYAKRIARSSTGTRRRRASA